MCVHVHVPMCVREGYGEIVRLCYFLQNKRDTLSGKHCYGQQRQINSYKVRK